VSFDTGAASGDGGGVLWPLATGGHAYDFAALVVLSTHDLINLPEWLTLRHSTSAAGITLSVFTAALTPGQAGSNVLIEAEGFPEGHTGIVWILWEGDETGSLYENDAAHSLTPSAESGDTVAKMYESVDGWPFVFAWVAGDLIGGDFDVPYFAQNFAGNASAVDDETVLLYEPDECSGFPTTYPFDLVLGTGQSFRYLVALDLAAPSNDRPVGCLVPGPPGVGWNWGGIGRAWP